MRMMYIIVCTYRKQLKLSERKVLWFTGFRSNVGNTLVDLASSALKVLQKSIAHKIIRENFCGSSQICKNCETFLSLNFYCLRYVCSN